MDKAWADLLISTESDFNIIVFSIVEMFESNSEEKNLMQCRAMPA
jgi:hypothetical protein